MQSADQLAPTDEILGQAVQFVCNYPDTVRANLSFNGILVTRPNTTNTYGTIFPGDTLNR